MATGTTTNLNENRYTIITDAMFLLGVNEAGQAIDDADMQLGVRFLNRLVKQWQAQGMHLWTNAYATVFLQVGLNEYILGNEAQNGAHWATDPIETSLAVNAAIGATTLTFMTTVGMLMGDHIGVVDNDNAVQWTTIASVVNGTDVTINTPLLVASDSGNFVFVYTERPASGAPLRVIDINRKNQIGQQTSTIIMPGLAFEDYFQLTNKQTPGEPINYNYQKDVNTGTIRLWPTPNNATWRLQLHYTRPIFNFDETSDDQDFAQEWIQALVYGLAVVLAPAYGKSAMLQILKPMADEMLYEANSYDQEPVSLYFSPSKYRY